MIEFEPVADPNLQRAGEIGRDGTLTRVHTSKSNDMEVRAPSRGSTASGSNSLPGMRARGSGAPAEAASNRRALPGL